MGDSDGDLEAGVSEGRGGACALQPSAEEQARGGKMLAFMLDPGHSVNVLDCRSDNPLMRRRG
jgi:hypothetical protein